MNPKAKSVDDTLKEIARASGDTVIIPPSTKELTRAAVLRYRATVKFPVFEQDHTALTQEQIDNGSDEEQRRQRFVSSSVKWSKRSWWRKLFS